MDNVIYSDSIPSSFVKKEIKRPNETGHGEAKLYLAKDYSSNQYLEFFNFYDDSNIYFFNKDNLLHYMNHPRIRQAYINLNLINYWNYHVSIINNFKPNISFELEKRTDTDDQRRYYIRSWDNIFREFFRSIALPDLTYVQISRIPRNDNITLYKFLLGIYD